MAYADEADAVKFAEEARAWSERKQPEYWRNFERGQNDTSEALGVWDRMYNKNKKLLASNPFDPECDDLSTTYGVKRVPFGKERTGTGR